MARRMTLQVACETDDLCLEVSWLPDPNCSDLVGLHALTIVKVFLCHNCKYYGTQTQSCRVSSMRRQQSVATLKHGCSPPTAAQLGVLTPSCQRAIGPA